MFSVSFKANQVDVIPYDGCPQPGATVRDNGSYAVFLDFTKIRSTRLLRGVCFHELGHIATGALHKYRAARWTAEQYLTEEAFRTAFQEGYTELWQLAEYFDLPEACIEAALTYWKDRKCVDFQKKD